MPSRPHRSITIALVTSLVLACTSSEGTTPLTGPGTPPTTPGAATLAVGSTAALVANLTLTLDGGAAGGEYALIVVDTAVDGRTTAATFQLTAASVATPGSVSQPSTSLVPVAAAARTPALVPDYAYAARLNARAHSVLTPRMGDARRAYRARMTASTVGGRSTSVSNAAVQVGDLLTLNVSEDACASIQARAARVVAIGATSVVVSDTLNPTGGFSTADYQRFAARFDTLVYPIDVANFGAPAAFGAEGKIVLFFTAAVNALTPMNSTSYVGGFFFDRDQFPVNSTPDLQGCKGSNNRNLFYLLAPDPLGSVNGNVRRTGFVDSVTTAVLAHEFQHLINSSRRLYVNANVQTFEVTWLNEGLSHVAEELLFYHEGRSGPQRNLDVNALRSSIALKDAYNADQSSNGARYREYLVAPSTNSPIRLDDSLATRGAAWDFLRYLSDRKQRTAGGTDASVWFALVNSTTSGIANLRQVFGTNIGTQLRDWSVSQYADDNVTGISADFTQPSWNWRTIFPALGSGATYPLAVSSLTASGASGSVIPGGATFYRFAIAPNASASLTLSASATVVQGTVVRIR